MNEKDWLTENTFYSMFYASVGRMCVFVCSRVTVRLSVCLSVCDGVCLREFVCVFDR